MMSAAGDLWPWQRFVRLSCNNMAIVALLIRQAAWLPMPFEYGQVVCACFVSLNH